MGAATFVVADARPDEGASLGRGLAQIPQAPRAHRAARAFIDGAKLLKEFGDEDPRRSSGAIRDKEILDAELHTFGPELSVTCKCYQ